MRTEQRGRETTVGDDRRDGVAITPQPSGTGRITETAFYDVVGNARRRACVDYLLQATGETAVTELVTHVVAAERGDSDPGHRKSVYASLRQTHLPKLESYDVVDYDPDRNVVTPARNLDAFEPIGTRTSPLPSSVPWAFLVLGALTIGWFTGGLLDLITLPDHRFLLVAFGSVLLVFLEGLWEVQQLRSALAQVGDGR